MLLTHLTYRAAQRGLARRNLLELARQAVTRALSRESLHLLARSRRCRQLLWTRSGMRKHGTPHRRALATSWSGGRRGAAAGGLCLASQARTVPPLASPGKGQDSKFEAQFLLNGHRVRTAVKSRNPKSNRCQLGTVCTLRNESLKPREEASAGDGNRGATQIEGVVGAAQGGAVEGQGAGRLGAPASAGHRFCGRREGRQCRSVNAEGRRVPVGRRRGQPRRFGRTVRYGPRNALWSPDI